MKPDQPCPSFTTQFNAKVTDGPKRETTTNTNNVGTKPDSVEVTKQATDTAPTLPSETTATPALETQEQATEAKKDDDDGMDDNEDDDNMEFPVIVDCT